jgi:hypothetical protein
LKIISILTFLFVIRLFFPSCQRTLIRQPADPKITRESNPISGTSLISY